MIIPVFIKIGSSQSIFSNYNILGLEQGLNTSNLSVILIDRDGFLWIGSTALQVYNGQTFYTIPTGIGPRKILGSKVFCLNQLDSSYIIVGTDKGISKINTRTFQIQNLIFPCIPEKFNITNRTQDILISSKGNIWAVTTGGIFHVNKNLSIIQSYYFPNDYTKYNNPIQPNRILEFPNGKIWVTGPRLSELVDNDQTCLFEIDPQNKFHHEIKPLPFKEYNRFLSFQQINDSVAVILYEDFCKNVQIIHYNLKSNTFRTIQHKPFQYYEMTPFLCKISDDEIGITCGTGKEYQIYNAATNNLVYHRMSPEILIKNLVKYKSNYFAATDKGLLKSTTINKLFSYSECKDIFPNESKYPTSVLENDSLIISTYLYSGVIIYDKRNQTCSLVKPISPYEPRTQISKIFIIDSSRWLICGNVSFWYNPILNKSWSFSKDIKSAYPFELFSSSVLKDSKNNIWFGTINRRGIYKYNIDSNTVIHYPLELFDKNQLFRLFNTIREDKNMNLWFGSVLGPGLLHWKRNANQFEIIYPNQNPGSYFNPNISSSAIDPDGSIWFGTQGYGIFKFNVDNFKITDYKDKFKLSDNYINTVNCDENGILWTTNINKLIRIDPKTFQCYEFNSYYGLPSDGITTHKVTGNPNLHYLINPKGYIYVHHTEFQYPIPDTTLIIRSIKANNQDVSIDQLSALSYEQNNLEIQFATPNLLDGFLNTYYFRFFDKDSNWISIGKEPILRLSGIGYGNYKVQLKICQNGSICFHKNLIDFNINRPYWKSPWYYGILILIFVSLLFSIFIYDYRLKISEIEKDRDKEILRNKIAQDIHDEVGSSLTKIALSAQVASRINSLSQEDLKLRLSHVAEDAKIASSQLRELVFSINPDFDHFDDMQAYFQEHARQYLEDSGIQLSFTLPKSKSNELVHPDIKRQLLLIFKEILNNIIKHAQAKQVWIRLEELPNKTYHFEIKDDGKGFDSVQAGKTSNGLRGMMQRAESISASLSLNSSPGSGTCIQLFGPLKLTNGY